MPAPRVCATLHAVLRLAWVAASGAALAAGTPPPSTAVHKCRGERGVPVYQESPCEPGGELRDFAGDPPPVSVVPFDAGRAPPPPSVARERRERDAPAPAPSADASAARAKAEARRFLREGMSDAEVRARAGAPDVTSGKGASSRWSYLPAPGDPSTITTVRFANGRVAAVERRVVR